MMHSNAPVKRAKVALCSANARFFAGCGLGATFAGALPNGCVRWTDLDMRWVANANAATPQAEPGAQARRADPPTMNSPENSRRSADSPGFSMRSTTMSIAAWVILWTG